MKNTKKILSVALAGALAFGSMGSAFAASTLTEGIDNKDVVKAVEKLSAFGIINGMEDGKYHQELELTRAQFAKMLVEALGLGSAAKNNTNKPRFADVDASSQWAWGYINVAEGQGLLAGYPDGTFKPSANVSYAEALTMLVRALGYKDSFLNGTWPGNYMAKAADLDITDDVTINGSTVNRGNAAILLSNTLDANMIEQKSFGDENNYEETNYTLSEKKLNIVKFEDAQVVGTPSVDTGIDSDQIKISYKDADNKDAVKTYDVDSKVNTNNLLGEGLNAYYNTKDKEIVYVEKSDKEFKTYYDVVDKAETIDKDEFTIIKADKKLNVDDEKVVYYIDNKSVSFDTFKTEALKGDLFVKAVADEKGNITVIDAQSFDKNGVIAVSADKDKFSFFDQDDSVKEMKAKDFDKVVVIDNLGNGMNLEDIKANDIVYVNDKNLSGDELEIASSKDEVLQLVVVRNAVQGKGKAWTNDEFEIEGKDYDVAANATVSTDENKTVNKYNSTKGNAELDDLTGEEAQITALLDAKGYIRHITTGIETSSDDMYGIVTGVDKRYSDVSVKILNKEGKEVEYVLDVDTFEGYADDAAVIASGEYDVVKYTLDKDGKIDTLTRIADVTQAAPDAPTADAGGAEIKAYVDTVTGDIANSSIKFTNDGSFAVDDDVLVFDYTAAYDGSNDIADATDVEVVKWADLVDKTAGVNTKAIYAVDENEVVKAVIFVDGFSALEDDAMGAYVKSIKTIDGDKYVDVILEGSTTVQRFELEGTAPAVESAVVLKKTSDGKVKVSTDADYSSYTGKVVKLDGKYAKVEYFDGATKKTKTVKVGSDALYYEKDDVMSYSDLDENDYVTIVAKGSEAKIVKLYDLDAKDANDAETQKFVAESGKTYGDWFTAVTAPITEAKVTILSTTVVDGNNVVTVELPAGNTDLYSVNAVKADGTETAKKNFFTTKTFTTTDLGIDGLAETVIVRVYKADGTVLKSSLVEKQ